MSNSTALGRNKVSVYEAKKPSGRYCLAAKSENSILLFDQSELWTMSKFGYSVCTASLRYPATKTNRLRPLDWNASRIQSSIFLPPISVNDFG